MRKRSKEWIERARRDAASDPKVLKLRELVRKGEEELAARREAERRAAES